MYTLLIVDDEKMIAEGVACLFPWEQIGFHPVAFSDPKEALDYAESNDIQVVMTDIEMPGMSGIDLCRELSGKGIRIVFMSSHQNYEYFRSAIHFQVTDYLLKPLKSSDILNVFERIRNELNAQAAIREGETPSYYSRVMEQVKAYLEENYQSATLEEAAVRVNLSSTYLSRLFKQQGGIGFGEWLLKVRMEKACELLSDIQMKSYDIAWYIGYDNPKSFSRAFKSYYGITPMEYRQGARPAEKNREDRP